MAEVEKMNWLDRMVSGDQRQLAEALDKTDPDPCTQEAFIVDPQKRMDAFESVVDLVAPQNVLAKQHPKLYFVAEHFESQVRALSVPQLLGKLASLEKSAFFYDKKTHTAKVNDFEAFFALNNYLKAIERISYKDPDYLKEVDKPEFYRFSILVADNMTPETRGLIFRMEKENWDLPRLFQETREDGFLWLKTYSGDISFFDEPGFKSGLLFGQYLTLKYPEEKITEANKEEFTKHEREYETIYLARGVSPEELAILKKLSKAELLKKVQEIAGTFPDMDSSEERVIASMRIMAISSEMNRRGMSASEGMTINADVVMALYKSHWRNISPKIIERAVRPQMEIQKSLSTESRLDNYRARSEFLSAIRDSVAQAINLGKFKDGTFDPGFQSFIGIYVLMGKNAKIPFTVSDLMDQAAVVRAQSHDKFFADHSFVAKESFAWDEIQQAEKITIPFSAYPTGSEELFGNEIDILKQITYRDVPAYDLVARSVDTVTFAKTLDKDHQFAGMAEGLFRHINLVCEDEKGNLRSLPQRLRILAHEAFHNMDGFKNLDGTFPAGNQSSLLAERSAYLFDAHVLKEYLKLRLQHAGEKPLSPKEQDEILTIIADDEFTAKVANFYISKTSPDFDIEDRRIELPLPLQLQIVSTNRWGIFNPSEPLVQYPILTKHYLKHGWEDWYVGSVMRQIQNPAHPPTRAKIMGAMNYLWDLRKVLVEGEKLRILKEMTEESPEVAALLWENVSENAKQNNLNDHFFKKGRELRQRAERVESEFHQEALKMKKAP
ncbi:MAG: hypothetical protein Q7T03_02290 [Deltaproteobacteria bacterium]|nr:hypothetical protein [Deltaproteobacteria bacterium]